MEENMNTGSDQNQTEEMKCAMCGHKHMNADSCGVDGCTCTAPQTKAESSEEAAEDNNNQAA